MHVGMTRLVATAIAGIGLAAAAVTAHGACKAEFEVCAAGSPWLRAKSAAVNVEFLGTGEQNFATYRFFAPDSVMIEREQRMPNLATTGKVLLVDGRVLLARDFELEKGREIQAVDGPLLMYQLAVALLASAIPEGPDQLRRRSLVDVEDRQRGILLETPSTMGFLGAPWRAKGFVDPQSEQRITYAFELEYWSDGAPRELTMSGTWSRESAAEPDPALSLREWKAFTLEPRTIQQRGYTTRAFEAKAIGVVALTLGDLRDALRRKAVAPLPFDVDAARSTVDAR
jgi:hypothetical protein